MKIWISASLFLIIICTLIACIVIHKDAYQINLDIVDIQYETDSSVKAHLEDGGLLVMQEGFKVASLNDTLIIIPNISGIRYDITRRDTTVISSILKDEIAFLETYKGTLDEMALLSGIPAATVGTIVLGVAIFGSCPTYYSYDGQNHHLEAEGFSYSIAPKFELEDLDRLHTLNTVNNRAHIQVKNEALETHYIDQLSLISIDHHPDANAYSVFSNKPFASKQVMVTSREAPILSAITREGKDVLERIIQKDDLSVRSDIDELFQLEKNAEHKDWIDISFDVPVDQREIYLKFHLRNSLISSVFLYDVLLDQQNYSAIDWTDKQLDNWLDVYRFFKWYNRFFGMSVSILENDKYREVFHFGDMGPISWSERVLPVKIKKGGLVRLRLSSLPDNWHIDWIGVDLKKMEPASIKEYTLEGTSTMKQFEEDRLFKDDGAYFIQYPGHTTDLSVSVDPITSGLNRSWFVRSKGYYTEWLRKEWLDPGENEEYVRPLELSDQLIKQLARKWILKKEKFEALFFETMITIQSSEL